MVLYNSETDEELLNSLGYKQELKREYSLFRLWALSFSILGVANAVVQLNDSILGGSVTMVWGWLIPGILILTVGMALGELGSAYPTSGGLYYYTFMFASPKSRRWVSFLCAWANTVGLIAGLAANNYGFANMVLSAVYVGTDGKFVNTKYEAFAIMIACTIINCAMGFLPSIHLSRVQIFGCFVQIVLLFIMCVGIPIGAARERNINSAKFVFTQQANLTEGWPYGLVFFISWVAVTWTIGAFDSCIHLSEEASNATTAVPYSIILSISMAVFLGAILECVLAACIKGGDFARVATAASGQPFSVIIYDSLGKNWTVAVMTIVSLSLLISGSSILTAASRQTYSVARDGVLPLSKYVRKINTKTALPSNAILFDCITCSVLGLLVLIDDTAANALFSLYVSSNSLSWLLPIACKLLKPKNVPFTPGAFYLGHFGSKLNGAISSFFLIFTIGIVSILPTNRKVTADTMNYTCLINPAIWIGALLYYFFDAHKWFEGPRSTLSEGEFEILDGASVKESRDKDTFEMRHQNVVISDKTK